MSRRTQNSPLCLAVATKHWPPHSQVPVALVELGLRPAVAPGVEHIVSTEG